MCVVSGLGECMCVAFCIITSVEQFDQILLNTITLVRCSFMRQADTLPSSSHTLDHSSLASYVQPSPSHSFSLSDIALCTCCSARYTQHPREYHAPLRERRGSSSISAQLQKWIQAHCRWTRIETRFIFAGVGGRACRITCDC